MSIVFLVGGLLLGVSFLAVALHMSKFNVSLFARQSYRQILALSALLVPVLLVASACTIAE